MVMFLFLTEAQLIHDLRAKRKLLGRWETNGLVCNEGDQRVVLYTIDGITIVHLPS